MSVSEMPVTCPQCQFQLSVGRHRAGEQVFCPGCGRSVVIPGSDEVADDVEIVDLPDPLESAVAGSRSVRGQLHREDTKACPYCGERIKAVARKCRFCGEFLPGGNPAAGETAYGIWRDGKRLVMDRDAKLPLVCLRTNEPCQRLIKREVFWHSPWLFLLIFVPPGVLLYIVVAAFSYKRAIVQFGLCESCIRRRRLLVGSAGLAFIAGAGMFVGAGIFAATSEKQPASPIIVLVIFMIIGGLLTMLLAVILGPRWYRVVRPTRITNDFIWLTGIHPDLLASLEPFPGE